MPLVFWLKAHLEANAFDLRSTRLGDYYDDRTVLKYLERLETGGRSPLAAAAAIVKIGTEATAALGNMKSSALQALQKVFPASKTNGQENVFLSEEYLGREDGYTSGVNDVINVDINGDDSSMPDMKYQIKDIGLKLMCGGVMVGLLALAGVKYLPGIRVSPSDRKELSQTMPVDISTQNLPTEEIMEHDMPKMNARFAEILVRKWQNIKSLALGPDHCVSQLPETER